MTRHYEAEVKALREVPGRDMLVVNSAGVTVLRHGAVGLHYRRR